MSTVEVVGATEKHVVTWERNGVSQRVEYDTSEQAMDQFKMLGYEYAAAMIGPSFTGNPATRKIRGGSGLSNIAYTPAVGSRFFGKTVVAAPLSESKVPS